MSAIVYYTAGQILFIFFNIEQEGIGVQEETITSLGQDFGNFLCCFDSSEGDIGSVSLDCFANEFSGHSFTLSRNNHGLFFLSSAVNDEGCSLGFLLSNLFSLDGRRKLG